MEHFWLANLPLVLARLQQIKHSVMLDVVRLPLLGATPAPGTWRFLGCFTLLVVVLAAALYSSCRRRVVYWI